MRSEAPIIFIHYGPANYLQWALESARKTNPEKRVILLGDQSNRKYARGHAEFVDFNGLSGGEKTAAFDRVFRVIQGERHRFTKLGGMEAWLKFVFRRWFLIEEFLGREGIAAFWTFDSDTLLLAPLGPREATYSGIAATTQCRGECLNGWVGSAGLVAGYTSCMLDLFRDETFLDGQRERLLTQAGLAFNEMDAFGEFRRRREIPVRRASEIIDGEAFDDALAFVDDYDPAPVPILGKTTIKQLWSSPHGGIWGRTSGNFVRLLSCNMSWMPDYLWKTILRSARVGRAEDLASPTPVRDLRPIDLREPHGARLRRGTSAAVWRVRRHLFPSRNPFASVKDNV